MVGLFAEGGKADVMGWVVRVLLVLVLVSLGRAARPLDVSPRQSP